MRHFFYIIHLCCGMEEANVEASSQLSIAPAPSDSDSPLPFPSTSQDGHAQAQQRFFADQDETQLVLEQPQSSSSIDPKSPVDTAAPIDSVRGAVSKFGGILDWKEQRKQVQDEIDKVLPELNEYQARSLEAESAKAQALRDLDRATSAVDDLRLGLKKAQIQELQARHEAELAEVRLRELQRGASESAAAKAELAALRDRRAAVLADLQSARTDLELLGKENAAATAEAKAAAARARQAAAASREAGKAVEGLASELIALKGELEYSQVAHHEAEEKRMVLASALEQDKSQWQVELEEAGLEAKKLRNELMAACDLEMKAEAASELVAKLKAELYEKPTALEKTRKELEDVKASVERARDEAKCLRDAAASMRDDVERHKVELAALQRRHGLTSASIPSLQEELRRVTSELTAVEARSKEGDDDESKITEQVGEARREAEQARAKALSARDEVARAREEATVAKAVAAAMEARLEAVRREILAANASEQMATSSAAALVQESNPSKKAAAEGEGGVTLTVEEYDELSRKAREMEEIAGKRVTEAVMLIQEAKDAEVRSLEKLAHQGKKTEQRRQVLEAATAESEEAEFALLTAERELRQCRAEHGQQRGGGGETSSPRAGLAEISVLHNRGASEGRGNPHIVSPRGYIPRPDVLGSAVEAEERQRRTFFPRMVMFLARRRAQAWK